MSKSEKSIGKIQDEALKMEIAEELGLSDKVKSQGWRSLTAKESGRIGGIMARRKRLQKLDDAD